MDFSILETYSFVDLKNMAKKMGLQARKSKNLLINDITEGLNDY